MNQCGGGEVVERKNRRRNVIEWGLSLLVSSPKPEQDWYSFGVKSPFSDENRTFDPFTIQSYNPLPRARSLLSKAVVPGRDGDYRRVQVFGFPRHMLPSRPERSGTPALRRSNLP